ncbi:MAG: hypothetical protein JWO41_30 [Candidatus Saccharibacteria bacterium]|nr:hypothetical protein [Candidatus Saccharibacteria bacterium]
MAGEYRVLYTNGIQPDAVEHALEATLVTFDAISAQDEQLETPIITRDLMGIAAAIHPYNTGRERDRILTIAQIGEIPDRETYKKFALKSVSRAFDQCARGLETDAQPMERLAWLADNALYRASSASVNGLHAGFAGGWPHHSRLVAVSFASSLAESMRLPNSSDKEHHLFPDDWATERLSWLNGGRDAGDNHAHLEAFRERYRFIFDLIAEPAVS